MRSVTVDVLVGGEEWEADLLVTQEADPGTRDMPPSGAEWRILGLAWGGHGVSGDFARDWAALHHDAVSDALEALDAAA